MSEFHSSDSVTQGCHIACIMDGNGRWAKKQGMLRVFGHEKGTKSVKQTVENCAKLGIDFLTLYAFLLMTFILNSAKKMFLREFPD